MTVSNIRLLIVDDHLVVRHGLRQLLSEAADIEIVGEADNGEEALYLCQKLRPDLILMDIRMPGMGGIAATAAIRQYHGAVRVIGLSTFAEEETEAAMIASGAQAHLSKTVTFEELVGAIRRVHAGDVIRRDQPAIAALAPHATAPAITPTITGQQRRVLALLTKGFTNAEIAGYLGFSAATAGYHVGAILAKLDVSNRAEAAAMAIREKLVDERDL